MNWQQAIIVHCSVKRVGRLAFSLLALLATPLPASAGHHCVLVKSGEEIFKPIAAAPDTEVRLSFNHSLYGSAVDEVFQVQADGFHLIQLRYGEHRLVDFYGHESAKFERGAWIVTPQQRIFPALDLRASPDASMTIALVSLRDQKRFVLRNVEALRIGVVSCNGTRHG
jgi:hypothetical protein